MTTVMSSLDAGAEMMTFLASGYQDVGPGLGGVGEEAGGLDHDVDAEVAPLQGGGVVLGEGLDLLVAHDDRVGGGRHVGVEAAEDRVVLEQVRQDGVVGQVVDADDLDVGARGPNCAGRSCGRSGRTR